MKVLQSLFFILSVSLVFILVFMMGRDSCDNGSPAYPKDHHGDYVSKAERIEVLNSREEISNETNKEQELKMVIASLERQLVVLEQELKSTKRDAQRWKDMSVYGYDEFTPRGKCLRNPEFYKVEDPKVRQRIMDWVATYDLDLQPGDITWLADRTIKDDWLDFAETSDEAVQSHFGLIVSDYFTLKH